MLLCVTFQRMPDALSIFLYNRPFFYTTHHSEAPRVYVPEFIEEDTSKSMKWQNSLQHCIMLLASTLCILISGKSCWIVLQTLNSHFTPSRVLWHFLFTRIQIPVQSVTEQTVRHCPNYQYINYRVVKPVPIHLLHFILTLDFVYRNIENYIRQLVGILLPCSCSLV